jgi:WD40 repeat protein/tRNA A-37 threonylcarbamoyl transferase component Bud32
MPASNEELLLALALTKAANARAAFLDRECAGNPTLRQRLEALLAAHDEPAELSASDALAIKATITLDLPDAPDEAVGQTLGRYKLLEKVGEGGCGVVYVAEQTEPVRRRVALKVIKLGMDTKQVVARFEAERQALAMMDHPNIAKVLDAGATENGRPFFVMELVRGIKITEYCDQNNLTTTERLDLFIKVCQAIQHAHQKGIIHRDIKPSNILVTMHDGVPVPKVIDFGIAKATVGQTLTDKTVYTQLQQFIGTPAYMSPEQAEMSGLDIDTRSDIYSLGVLLYELLTGRTPFSAEELAASGLDAMRKTIREKDPVRPSTRLGTLSGEELTTTAKRRSADTAKLLHQLKGDLDWIVMKCLEKDRTRRYETANGVAFDLKRHLNNEPVLARPPSAAYKFQKAFRRNKLVFAAGTAVAVALVAGLCLAALGWRQTRVERDKAIQAQAQAVAAQANETRQRQLADAARANEANLRQQAEAAELTARQRAYASDMNVAMQALDGSNLGRALDLLNRQRPGPGQRDLRGWEWRYLWQQTHSDALFTLCQESAEINSLSVSPDGLSLAIGSLHQGGVSVRDLRTRQELFRLATNELRCRVAFSPTEPLLAFAGVTFETAAEEHTSLHLWNTVTRQMVAEFPLDASCIGFAFSQDGRRLVTSTYRGHITLWRMPEGTQLASYPSAMGGLAVGTSFAGTADLSLVAGELSGGRISVVDLRDGKELWTAEAAKVYVTALAFSPDGKFLTSAAGFSESDIRLWDVATGKESGRLEGHGTWVSSIVFSPDGKKLISSSADQTIRIWDVASRTCLDVLRGHRAEVWRLALFADGKTLVSGAKDGTVCFWDTSVTHPRQPRITIPDNLIAGCWATDSRSVLAVNKQGQVSRWIGPNFQQKESLLDGAAGLSRPSISQYQFSKDGRLLAVGSANGVLQIWDLQQRVLFRQWTNNTGNVEPKSFLADGNRLVTETWSRTNDVFQEWDCTTGLEKQSWRAPTNFSGAIAFSPDERSCVASGMEGDAVIRNLGDQSQRKTNLGTPESAWACYSPDGKRFAVASYLGYARVWDTATWRPEATLGGFLNSANSVAFSPDGKRLAIGGGDKEAVRLCDTESWQDVLTLESQGFTSGEASFSPDGNAIGWLNMTGDFYLWRAPSWGEINAAEAKDPPSQGYGGQGKAEIKQP